MSSLEREIESFLSASKPKGSSGAKGVVVFTVMMGLTVNAGVIAAGAFLATFAATPVALGVAGVAIVDGAFGAVKTVIDGGKMTKVAQQSYDIDDFNEKLKPLQEKSKGFLKNAFKTALSVGALTAGVMTWPLATGFLLTSASALAIGGGVLGTITHSIKTTSSGLDALAKTHKTKPSPN